MKNEKVRFLAQGKRFAGTEPEEAFCASPLPQVTDRGWGGGVAKLYPEEENESRRLEPADGSEEGRGGDGK